MLRMTHSLRASMTYHWLSAGVTQWWERIWPISGWERDYPLQLKSHHYWLTMAHHWFWESTTHHKLVAGMARNMLVVVMAHYRLRIARQICETEMTSHRLTHWDRDKMTAIFKCIFLNENARISIKISLKFVPKGPINKIPALVQMMAWHRPGDKPLSEPMVVRLLTRICVTRPQWVKGVNYTRQLGAEIIHHRLGAVTYHSLGMGMAHCRLRAGMVHRLFRVAQHRLWLGMACHGL